MRKRPQDRPRVIVPNTLLKIKIEKSIENIYDSYMPIEGLCSKSRKTEEKNTRKSRKTHALQPYAQNEKRKICEKLKVSSQYKKK